MIRALPSDARRPENTICLVTGAFGFLGRHIVRELLRHNYSVRVLDRESPRKGLEVFGGEVEVFLGSRFDQKLLSRCTEGVSALFHFVGTTLPAESNLNPTEDVGCNLRANLEILTAAANSGVERVIFPSSGGTVYGIPEVLPVPESHPTNPISSYGIVKLTTEKYLALFERQFGMRGIALRYGNPYGEGQYASARFGVIASFLNAAAMDRPLEIWGDGGTVRDFVYIEDVIDATIKALHYDGPARIFNIGSGIGASITDLVRTVQQVTGASIQVLRREGRAADVPQIVLNVSRARQELGWQPRISLVEGMTRAWEWCLQGLSREVAVTGRAS